MLRKIMFFLFVTIGLGISACQSQPTPTATPILTKAPVATIPPNPTVAKLPVVRLGGDPLTNTTLRFVAAVPDAPAFDIYLEGTSVSQELAYGTASSQIFVAPGHYQAFVVPTGTTPDAGKTFVTQSLTLTAGQSLIDIFTGTAKQVTASLVPENLGALPSGQARLTFADALPSGSVTITDDSQALGKLDTIGQTTTAAQVAATKHTLAFTPGTNQTLTLEQRLAYTVIVLNTNPVNLLILSTPVHSEGMIRVINLSAIAAVDAYLEPDQSLALNLAQRQGSDWQHLAARDYTLSFYTAGMYVPHATPIPSPVGGSAATQDTNYQVTLAAGRSLYQMPVRLEPDANLDLIFYGDFANGLGVLTYTEDLSQTPAGMGRVVFLNLNPTQVSVDAEPFLPKTLTDYSKFSDPVYAPAQPTEFAFRAPNQEKLVELAQNIDIQAGSVYLYVITGFDRTSNIKPAIYSTTGTATTLALGVTPTGSLSDAMNVRLVNATTSIDSLGLQLGGVSTTSVFKGIKRGALTAPVPIPRPTEALHFTANDTAYLNFEVNFIAGATAELIVTGDSKMGHALQLIEDTNALNGKASVTMINGAIGKPTLIFQAAQTDKITPAAPQQTVFPTVTNNELLNAVAANNLTAPRILDPGVYNLVILNTTQEVPVATLPNITLEADKHYDLIAVTNTNNGIDLILDSVDQ